MDATNNEDNEPQYRTVGRVVGGQLFQWIERIETEESR